MLKRFLPSFPASKQNPPPNPQNPSNTPEVNIGFHKWGTIFRDELSNDAYKRGDLAISIYKRLTYFILIIFLILLILNAFLDLRLTSQKSLVDELARQLGNYSQTSTQAIEVDKEIAFYKKTLTQRVTLGAKSRAVFGNIGPTIKLNSASLDVDKFRLEIEVANPFEFANLMDAYSKTGVINEISLDSANLVPTKGIFEVSLQGNYK